MRVEHINRKGEKGVFHEHVSGIFTLIHLIFFNSSLNYYGPDLTD